MAISLIFMILRIGILIVPLLATFSIPLFIYLSAFGQEKVYAEPEEEETSGPANNNSGVNKNHSNFNFVVAGDFGCGENAKRTVSNMLSKKPELVMTTGDLSYSKTADCWFDIISPLDKDGKVKIAFGDHDLDSNLLRFNQYMKHFNLSEPYYSFDYHNIHFLVMATGKSTLIPYNETSSQYQFVKQDLIKASKHKGTKWIIVISYRPFYTSPTNHPVLDSLQDSYHPLFDKYGVDLVLQGHNHNYQRTYPLAYNNTDPSSPVITDRHTRDYKDEKGEIFLTVGTGGKELYNFTGQSPFVISQFERRGFLNVDLTKEGKNLTATFFENREIKDKDHFSIFKKGR